ncbi:M90 family metallopeptidase [Chitinimonas sp. PSY-7]|uniref:zinc-dependent peptidase n=1 Tax=Chitinimonas sp. PSY-7 TaxID=3459088 RepID=UPI00403FF632
MLNLLRRTPPPDPLAHPAWPELGRQMPLLSGLGDCEWWRLEARMRHFLTNKAFHGVEGFALSQRRLLQIAAQACLPIINLGDKAYADWNEVILYPHAFVNRTPWRDEAGLVHEGEWVLAGQARQDGPILLAWPDAQRGPILDGRNVVIHECAHKLDMLNGTANGFPPLHASMHATDWTRAFETGYVDFTGRLARGETVPIDPYAAENPAEFFAVLSEYFFELPHLVHDQYPTIYEQLRQFYRQDPGERLPLIDPPSLF